MTKFASSTTGLHRWSRSWEVQRAPFRKPLPYRYVSSKETQYPGYSPGTPVSDWVSMNCDRTYSDLNLVTLATNAARQKAVEQAKGGASAALGLTIMDWRSSLSMISNALRGLTSKRQRAKLYYKRKASELYLEGIFGWLPLMQDIYAATQVFDRAIPTSFAKGRGNASYTTTRVDPNFRGILSTQVGSLVGLGVRLDNPNIALVENLGLLNPAAIAWDKVPYSFVINWFVPVGTYLTSLTDLVGYEVRDGYSTSFVRKIGDGSIRYWNSSSQRYEWAHRRVEKVYVERSLGLPSFVLPKPALPRADLTKALISLALFDSTREPPPRNSRNR